MVAQRTQHATIHNVCLDLVQSRVLEGAVMQREDDVDLHAWEGGKAGFLKRFYVCSFCKLPGHTIRKCAARGAAAARIQKSQKGNTKQAKHAPKFAVKMAKK